MDKPIEDLAAKITQELEAIKDDPPNTQYPSPLHKAAENFDFIMDLLFNGQERSLVEYLVRTQRQISFAVIPTNQIYLTVNANGDPKIWIGNPNGDNTTLDDTGQMQDYYDTNSGSDRKLIKAFAQLSKRDIAGKIISVLQKELADP